MLLKETVEDETGEDRTLDEGGSGEDAGGFGDSADDSGV